MPKSKISDLWAVPNTQRVGDGGKKRNEKRKKKKQIETNLANGRTAISDTNAYLF